ncbi:VanZ family protein [Vibrio rhizosphaerae]|uniref:VanZ family protein n=1 Tax=Vibrio rhizosphaerae TaxID=398736 RepID=A0ABU4IY83_9VIBR|nr:VanZ family protein [Vibrio rhizosphaerae]MDW6093229.1 VanZ family protein [Vibrio rhizosphaerae]
MNKLHIIKQYWLNIMLLILAVITVLSLWPLATLPNVPGTDKTHHFIAYAALMFPVALRQPARWGWIGVALLAYSGGIELIQPYVNRYGEWLDLAANAGGLFCGWLLARGLNYFDSRGFSAQD